MALPLPLNLKNSITCNLEDDDDRECSGDQEMKEFDEEILLDSEDIGESTSRSSANFNAMCRRVGDEVKCSACDFTTRSRIMLQRHERLTHLKKKFFRCVKCNYVTHVKARYTKHVKYHSMPMIKCDLCEFRTPYKWNLDRHLKNHMGGGMYKCSLCNFTAHIKQSLTVHIQNHHLSPEKARSSRRRNKVGASDELAEAAMDADELELLRLEREADEEGPPSDNEMSDKLVDENMAEFEAANEEEDRKSGLKMTFRKIKSPSKSALDEGPSDFVHPDLAMKNVRADVKHFKCSQCHFKTMWESELIQHEAKNHGYAIDKEISNSSSVFSPANVKTAMAHSSNSNSSNESSRNNAGCSSIQTSPVRYGMMPSPPVYEPTSLDLATNRKKARPIPNLIPINSVSNVSSPPSSCDKSVPTILKIPQIHKRSWEASENEAESPTTSPILEAVGLLAKQQNAMAEDKNHDESLNGINLSKKKSSFLDQLAEKLTAGNETRSLNEESRCNTTPARSYTQPNVTSWSSRCQHCRQRCKTRADLLAHIKHCPQAIAAQTGRQTPVSGLETEEASATSNATSATLIAPHPMENKVFVWTRMEESTNNLHEDVEPMEIDAEEKRPSSVAGSDVSEASLVGIETAPGIGSVTGGAGSSGLSLENGRLTIRRVYRCPQCSFWATTASRFHVHMVGHTNTKPFECSQCAYRSNWR